MQMHTPPAMTDFSFQRLRQLARANCGISLQESKKAMVSSRLDRVIRRGGFDSYERYLDLLEAWPNGPEFSEFIDTLTTNHSGFWREAEHFVFLQKQIFHAPVRPLRIWSAACATGEEPYTIAMCAIDSGASRIQILATDISRTALAAAQAGVYDSFKVAGLPPSWADRYFEQRDTRFEVTRRVRAMVQFQPVNLLHPIADAGSFDVIFCRNVMIYFDRETQDGLIERLVQRISPGGFLFTGHSESLLHLPPTLEYVQPAVYRKV